MMFQTSVFLCLIWLIILTQSASSCNRWHKDQRLPKKRLQPYYDFIIAGGGSAGCVLAGRLSEDPNVQVLLLEAGGLEDIRNEIPMAFGLLQVSEQIWQFKSEPQANSCLGLRNRQGSWSRGKVLGGTSSVNGMVYTRGNKRDFDRWAEMGNHGWSYDEVLPYFKKAEGATRSLLFSDTMYHGTSGPLTVSSPSFFTPAGEAFLQGVKEIGYPIRDVNGEFQTGAMPVMSTTRNGRRCSAAKAYIEPAIRRPNLHIITHAYVLKVLIDDNKRAYGVLFAHDGQQLTAKATKEVILSAGAVNSPKLLMLSGIGPRWHLEQHGINVIVDLPGVGQNMQDQVGTGGLLWTLEAPVTINLPTLLNPFNVKRYLLQYLLSGQGVLSSTSGAECVAFVHTKYSDRYQDWPDVQLLFVSMSQLLDGGLLSKSIIGTSDESWDKYYAPVKGVNSIILLPNIARPRSRGFVQLRSSNPDDHPLIEPNYFNDATDLQILIEGVKIAHAIVNTTLFRKYGAKFIPTVVPGCERIPLYSDDYWECLIRHLTFTMYHTVGTAKMGLTNDPTAVVSPELKVYNIESLRVIDASVMPEVTTSNTNAPVIMIAEKAADLIKRQWDIT